MSKNYNDSIGEFLLEYKLKVFVVENGTNGILSGFFTKMKNNKKFFLGGVIENSNNNFYNSDNLNAELTINTNIDSKTCTVKIYDKVFEKKFDIDDEDLPLKLAVKTMVFLYDLLENKGKIL